MRTRKKNGGLRECKRAFTLIELLVVVAVIAILAAILFPVFARARENARRSSCMSNLKQIGLSMMMYVQDNDEHLTPQANNNANIRLPNGDNSPTAYWYQMLYAYMKNIQILNCPSETTKVWTSGGYESTVPVPYGINYVQPAACYDAYGSYTKCGVQMAPANAAGANLGAIEDPSGTLLIVDSKYYILQFDHAQTAEQAESSGQAGGLGACSHSGSSYNYAGCVSARHLGTANVLFVDGHVKSMQWQTLVGSQSVSSWKYWTTNAD
jgi:prepilin-type N-terminal cleavage/methylation domain-containing protein/prepilin-type processing-associated H-X9-DG protein